MDLDCFVPRNDLVLGLDEVGRGPLAGPVGVGGVVCLSGFFQNPLTPLTGGNSHPSWYYQIKDSKKLSAGQRSYLASEILACPQIVSATALVSAQRIDEVGISKAIGEGLQEVIDILRSKVEKIGGLDYPPLPLSQREGISWNIKLDGKVDYGLRKIFPDLEIETIIKGDQKVWEIAAASIVAKVHRDQYMIELSQQEQYSMYGFERHKGYGTRVHREAIQQYGLSDEHRTSFIHFV